MPIAVISIQSSELDIFWQYFVLLPYRAVDASISAYAENKNFFCHPA